MTNILEIKTVKPLEDNGIDYILLHTVSYPLQKIHSNLKNMNY